MPIQFLLQTERGHLLHDFAFTLREAVRFHQWWDPHDVRYTFRYRREGDPRPLRPHEVPVGSLGFVEAALRRSGPLPARWRPLNVPPPLQPRPFSGRRFASVTLPTPAPLPEWVGWFCKSADQWKTVAERIPSARRVYPAGAYQVSEWRPLASEWRAFVYRAELVGIHWYAGDFRRFPDLDAVEAMIQAYGAEAPPAYTLDVGQDAAGGQWVVVEAHPFVSCALYGFADLARLPAMFRAAWDWIVRSSAEVPTRGLTHSQPRR